MHGRAWAAISSTTICALPTRRICRRVGNPARTDGFQTRRRRRLSGDRLDQHLERRREPESLRDAPADARLHAFAFRIRFRGHGFGGSHGGGIAKRHARFHDQDTAKRVVLAERRKDCGSFWGNGVIQKHSGSLRPARSRAVCELEKLPDETLIKPFVNPGAIHVVVTGGKIQTTWFVTDFGLRRGIKVDDWA